MVRMALKIPPGTKVVTCGQATEKAVRHQRSRIPRVGVVWATKVYIASERKKDSKLIWKLAQQLHLIDDCNPRMRTTEPPQVSVQIARLWAASNNLRYIDVRQNDLTVVHEPTEFEEYWSEIIDFEAPPTSVPPIERSLAHRHLVLTTLANALPRDVRQVEDVTVSETEEAYEVALTIPKNCPLGRVLARGAKEAEELLTASPDQEADSEPRDNEDALAMLFPNDN